MHSIISQLVDVVNQKRFFVLDTETTGLHTTAEPVQIAVIDQDGRPHLNTLLRPVNPIPHDATLIHGITTEQCADAPTWPQIRPELLSLTAGIPIIVYNAVYDRRILHQADQLNRLSEVSYKTASPWICAMEAYSAHYGQRRTRGGYVWQSLADACTRYSIPTGDHSALADAQATLAVVRRLAKRYGYAS